MQRGSTLWTVTRFPQAVQANWPFAKVPAGQNSTYSSSPALADETLNCDSSTSSPFTSGPRIASRSILLVGRQERSVNRLATTFNVHFRGGSTIVALSRCGGTATRFLDRAGSVSRVLLAVQPFVREPSAEFSRAGTGSPPRNGSDPVERCLEPVWLAEVLVDSSRTFWKGIPSGHDG